MNGMKGRALAVCAALGLGILFSQAALAQKVSYIEETGDTAYHLAHLLTHDAETICMSTADEVMLRIAPGSGKIHGRMMQGERFVIIDSYGEWLRVEIVSPAPQNEESRRGMTGWVHADYIDCSCTEEAYYAENAAQ